MLKSTKELARDLGILRKRTSSNKTRQQREAKARQIFAYLVVLDFESTCWRDDKYRTQEIIEFPAVLMSSSDGKILSEFHFYVQPTESPTLSDFCRELTGITQEQVNDGIPISICLPKFSRWLKSISEQHKFVYNTETYDGQLRCTFVTWSDWDLGVCLLYEARRKQLRKPAELSSWIDLRATYRKFYGRKPKGLNGALQDLGLNFEGREHSGIVDAQNTARLAYRMICDGSVLTITKSLQGTNQSWSKPQNQVLQQPIVTDTLLPDMDHKKIAVKTTSVHSDGICHTSRSSENTSNTPRIDGKCLLAKENTNNSVDKVEPLVKTAIVTSRQCFTSSVPTIGVKSVISTMRIHGPGSYQANVCCTNMIRSIPAISSKRPMSGCMVSTSSTKSLNSKKGRNLIGTSFVVHRDVKTSVSSTALPTNGAHFKDITNTEFNKESLSRGVQKSISLKSTLATSKLGNFSPLNCGFGLFKTPFPPAQVSSHMKRTPPMCGCGRRSKRKFVRNDGPNLGRTFFCCGVPNSKQKRCNFFKWEPTDGDFSVGTSPMLQGSYIGAYKSYTPQVELGRLAQPDFNTPQSVGVRKTLGVKNSTCQNGTYIRPPTF